MAVGLLLIGCLIRRLIIFLDSCLITFHVVIGLVWYFLILKYFEHACEFHLYGTFGF